ncbi:MAG TPA: M20/M25/M40 family metallo-hydrolase [Myxococcaceae bacterium]|nr:M20/M25/M40 family metallo-hydrolase [Myxococcaceae bacterium]
MRTPALLLSLLAAAASGAPPAAPPPRLFPDEDHLSGLRQLTFSGENAEAYWSFDGKKLSLQSHQGGVPCDRIYSLSVAEDPPRLVPISNGQGVTTCSHFLLGDKEVVYSSTQLGGAACPPRLDHSMGYVWPLHPTYDVFRANADGTNVRRLTDAPGYDAETTVCPKDGSLIFTSVRDGDLDLYRMDADGKNVRRITSTPGYDGGAFFSRDCSKIVWRASRPKPGPELDEYRALLAKNLVKPGKLELWVANADGTEPRQVTDLGGASFAPYFFPDGERIIFSSNWADPKGREFDLWAVNVNGTGLERITTAPGFDGFPMFSPDGQWLAFSSNRATAPGEHDTNVFLARFRHGPAPAAQQPADRVLADVAYLADPAREGRGIGTPGLAAAGAYLEQRFQALGLKPAGDGGTYRQAFKVTTKVELLPESKVVAGKAALPADAFTAMGFSGQGRVKAPMRLVGYGLVLPDLQIDDYKGVDLKGKIAVLRRFVPDRPELSSPELQRRHGDLRQKVWLARERGAKAVVVVDWPVPPSPKPADWQPPSEAAFPSLRPQGFGDAGLPVVMVKRSALEPVMAALEAGKPVGGEVKVGLRFEQAEAFNVVGRLEAKGEKADGRALVIGAHYDHLGMGGPNSLAPDKSEPHLGADDNASGTAALLETVRRLAESPEKLSRDVVAVAFSGEEEGVLGSTHFTRTMGDKGMKSVAAMLNFDMVGRLRANKLSVLGADSAAEWAPLVAAACEGAGLECSASGDGYGPSDQTPFYAAGVPVLHFFTGAHFDYHKPSDSADRINATGIAQVVKAAAGVALALGPKVALTYRQVPAPAPTGDMRSFNASLGTIPDYAGPPNGQKGVLLAGVRPGGGADQAGMRRGDILVQLGTHDIGGVEDLMYALNASKPGQTVSATVLRDGKPVKLTATFQESKRPR